MCLIYSPRSSYSDDRQVRFKENGGKLQSKVQSRTLGVVLGFSAFKFKPRISAAILAHPPSFRGICTNSSEHSSATASSWNNPSVPGFPLHSVENKSGGCWAGQFTAIYRFHWNAWRRYKKRGVHSFSRLGKPGIATQVFGTNQILCQRAKNLVDFAGNELDSFRDCLMILAYSSCW